MAKNKRIGYGITIAVQITSGSTFRTLGTLVDDIDFDDVEVEQVDITLLADKFKSFANGQADPGGVSFNIAYEESATGDSEFVFRALKNCTPSFTPNWKVHLPAGTASTSTTGVLPFAANVSGLGFSAPKAGLIVQPITLKKSGAPGFTT